LKLQLQLQIPVITLPGTLGHAEQFAALASA
jgi:hypothetical protein